ncbi:MAG: DUF3081 domain-containing protein [Paraglaciecola sp.]|uniref:DUF3081 domain-containing protein n=1 Tax=Pseudomonadati TaxID=3379134 RepID=UPI00273ED59C|nr:DUF3081 domain-containing protein [Paraglaciecola sp.]MDP5032214.1 DUF3081 domain-containing protein [Paraglaciecola sp.]MDP5133384.1 DUF3081 domain-containing protein [Paraglaciecola sp.]
MKNEIDSKFILKVFETIRLKGKKKDEAYFLEGVEASTDFDGYTLFMKDALVELSFGFHNQYHFNYEKEEHAEQFIRKLQAIAAL